MKITSIKRKFKIMAENKKAGFDEHLLLKFDTMDQIKDKIENMPINKQLEVLSELNQMITSEIEKIKRIHKR